MSKNPEAEGFQRQTRERTTNNPDLRYFAQGPASITSWPEGITSVVGDWSYVYGPTPTLEAPDYVSSDATTLAPIPQPHDILAANPELTTYLPLASEQKLVHERSYTAQTRKSVVSGFEDLEMTVSDVAERDEYGGSNEVISLPELGLTAVISGDNGDIADRIRVAVQENQHYNPTLSHKNAAKFASRIFEELRQAKDNWGDGVTAPSVVFSQVFEADNGKVGCLIRAAGQGSAAVKRVDGVIEEIVESIKDVPAEKTLAGDGSLDYSQAIYLNSGESLIMSNGDALDNLGLRGVSSDFSLFDGHNCEEIAKVVAGNFNEKSKSMAISDVDVVAFAGVPVPFLHATEQAVSESDGMPVAYTEAKTLRSKNKKTKQAITGTLGILALSLLAAIGLSSSTDNHGEVTAPTPSSPAVMSDDKAKEGELSSEESPAAPLTEEDDIEESKDTNNDSTDSYAVAEKVTPDIGQIQPDTYRFDVQFDDAKNAYVTVDPATCSRAEDSNPWMISETLFESAFGQRGSNVQIVKLNQHLLSINGLTEESARRLPTDFQLLIMSDQEVQEFFANDTNPGLPGVGN